MTVRSRTWIIAGTVACAVAALPFGAKVFAQNQTQTGTPTRAQAGGRAATPAAAATGPKIEMSDKYFKKVQVLTNIPVDEFMGTMGLFSAALSYCCGDCHVGAGTDNPDWASDKNPRKVVARRMAAMVKEINKSNFGGGNQVTCWTCHRGSPNPAVTPSIDTIYGEPLSFPPDTIVAAKAGQGALSLDQIFDKYTQALGGTAATSRITSYEAKGTSHLFGETREDPMELYAKAPDDLATIVHQRGGDLARTYDGRDAWVMLPLTVVSKYPLTGGAKEGGKLDAELAFPWRIRSFYQNWKVGIPISIDGKDVQVVQASVPGLIATFYFDKTTGLMTRMVRMANSAAGRVPTQIDYSDYRPVAGVQMPFKWTYGWVSGREEYVVTSYDANATVDAAKFREPQQRAK